MFMEHLAPIEMSGDFFKNWGWLKPMMIILFKLIQGNVLRYGIRLVSALIT